MPRWTIAAMILVALPASAQAMTVAQRVADAYRADLTAARQAGRTPHSCPPPKGKASFGAKEVMAEFNAIPPARRNMSVKTAFYAMMKKRYPCKG